MCWLRLCGVRTRAARTVWMQASGVSLDVLAAVMWSQDTSCSHFVNAGVWCNPGCAGCGCVESGHELRALCEYRYLHSHSARSSCPDSTQPQPAHPGLHQTLFYTVCLLTMGKMMPETCWVNLLWINIYRPTCVICWFYFLLCRAVWRNILKKNCASSWLFFEWIHNALRSQYGQ